MPGGNTTLFYLKYPISKLGLDEFVNKQVAFYWECIFVAIAYKYVRGCIQGSCCLSSCLSTYCNHHGTNWKGTLFFVRSSTKLFLLVCLFSALIFMLIESQVCKGDGRRKQHAWWGGSKGWMMDDGSFLSLIQDVHCNILLVNGQYQLREERWFFFGGRGVGHLFLFLMKVNAIWSGKFYQDNSFGVNSRKRWEIGCIATHRERWICSTTLD